jgi:hypothetical protein
MLKRDKITPLVKSRMFVSVLAGVTSLYTAVACIILLLHLNILLHSLWITGNGLILVLMLLMLYGFIGVLLGLSLYLLEHLLLNKLVQCLGPYPNFILNYLLISILVGVFFYSIFFDGDIGITNVLGDLYILILVILILLPYVLMLLSDSAGIVLKPKNRLLMYAVAVFCTLIVFKLATPLLLSNPYGKATETLPAKPKLAGKYIIFGFDGATWELMDPLLAQGRLPNMKKLIDSGVKCNFTSIYYDDRLMSPVVWTTIFTGKTPEKHGITGYLVYVLDDSLLSTHKTPPTSSFRRTKALWNILSDFNISVGFVGLWSTWPAEEVNGFMVSDHLVYLPWQATEGGRLRYVTYPESIYDEVNPLVLTLADVDSSMLLRFVHQDSLRKFESEDTLELFNTSQLNRLKISISVDKSHINSARYLNDKYNPDVLFIYLEGSDIIEHFFWGYRLPELFPEFNITADEVAAFQNIIDDYFVFYDGFVGDFMEDAPENTTFIIISDHGLSPILEPDNWSVHAHYFADHSPVGVFMVSGPNFRRNHSVSHTSVLDFTPTMLYSMGLPVAEDMDGYVIRDIFTEDFVETTVYSKVSSYDREYERELVETPIEDEVEGRLRELGYLK